MKKSRNAKNEAKHLVISRTAHGKSRKELKKQGQKAITSIGTEKKYMSCVKIFVEHLQKNGVPTSNVTAEIAETFLTMNTHKWAQKTIDGYRQAIEMVFGIRFNHVVSNRPDFLKPRAYSLPQVNWLCQHSKPKLCLSIRIAHAAGLRTIGLDTIARTTDFSEDKRPWLNERFYGKENEVRYVVVEKGGLRRQVSLPKELADELEKHRLPAPTRKRSREIYYTKRYDIVGGQSFSNQFSRLSKHLFGWSTGAHGLRHAFARNRILFLQKSGIKYDFALQIVSQEIGHFSTKNTKTYMR